MEPKEVAPEATAPLTVAAYSIDEFCAAHRLSKSLLFSLWRDGRGPRRMVMGRVVRITAEAAAEWRREIETFPCGASTEWMQEARERLRGSRGAHERERIWTARKTTCPGRVGQREPGRHL